MLNPWDSRYDTPDYMYGVSPNDFLKEHVSKLPKGNVLCLADGEGRNGVFLASKGYSVTSVDSSKIGLKKAQDLALEHGVFINTICEDLAYYSFAPNHYHAIVSIFCHLPTPLRKQVHENSIAALRPGGAFLLEAYTPKQLEFKTGGPPNAELMMSAPILEDELKNLTTLHLVETQRNITEGKLHNGPSAVVQYIGQKPNT